MNVVEYTDRLVFELQRIGADVTEAFRKGFLWHARRLGSDSYADLGAMVFTECLELKRDSHPLDERTMGFVLDRIRKRLTRELKGTDRIEPLGDRPVADQEPPVDQRMIQSETVKQILKMLDPLDLMLVELRLLGHSWHEVAQTTGMNPVTVRQRFSRIRKHFSLEKEVKID